MPSETALCHFCENELKVASSSTQTHISSGWIERNGTRGNKLGVSLPRYDYVWAHSSCVDAINVSVNPDQGRLL